MSTEFNGLRLWSGVLAVLSLVLPGQAHAGCTPPEAHGRTSVLASQAAAIPWSQIGAKATADYKGDGLSVAQTGNGALLRCVIQRLEAEATTEGLWLTSTLTNSTNDRFRIVAADVRRLTPTGNWNSKIEISQSLLTSAATDQGVLSPTGTVEVADNLVRFIRPGLIEEYSVSMDGLRQDFVIQQKPAGEGQLRVELSVTGAQVEPTPDGVQLLLENSGRKIAYTHLRVTDATERELPARLQVAQKSEIRNTRNIKPEMQVAVLVADAQAVYPIRIDPTFSDANWISMGGVPGANGPIHATVLDASGNLYIGGSFTVVGDLVANYIAKWDGSSWSALGSGMGGAFLPYVYTLAVSGTNLYAGGLFTTAGGSPANYIAKWDGSSWSGLGSGIAGDFSDTAVYALAVSGSDLYAGGIFAGAGGIQVNHIAKWNGSSWSPLGSGIAGKVFDTAVYALAVGGSDLYAAGEFTFATAGGSAANSIAKWNGSTWTNLGSGMDDLVSALAVWGGDLHAGGAFTTAGGVSANYIAKWDGGSWSALGSGMNNWVGALAVSGSGLYAGGSFTMAGASPAPRIAKWDGSSWSALDSGPDDTVSALAVSGSDLYAGGWFRTADAMAANYIAKWNGSSWRALSPGINSTVSALAVSGNELYAGGFFTHAGRSAANYVARWNGTDWSALGSGMGGLDPYNAVNALAVSGSDLYAGGEFRTAGGSPATGIAKWNGSSWSALGSGINGWVDALAVSGTDLYAGGEFTTAGGNPANHIAKWNGTNWTALGLGMNYRVYALAVSGSNLYAGGEFTTAGGNPANAIAKWDGSSWSALGLGMGFDPYVYALAVSGSNLYAGGKFMTAGGSPANAIAKWDGSSWSALGSGIGGEGSFRVSALAILGSDLYAGGSFSSAGSSPANAIAKWDGSSWNTLGSGINSWVMALALSGNDLYAGGNFIMAGGKASAFISRAVLGDAPGYNRLTGTLLSDGAMQFSYIGYPATNYALDRTLNLAPPMSWVGQETNTMTVSGILTFTNTPAPATNNFWRVRSVP